MPEAPSTAPLAFRRTPQPPVRSSYRLQLRPDLLTFTQAAALAEYLQQLGVTHVYLSPIVTAMPGSVHGYDITDPTRVSSGLGGRGGFKALSDELRSRSMGLLVDIVPNHVAVGNPRHNGWWWDVLRHGSESPFAHFFDIDWSPNNGAGGRVALPVLPSQHEWGQLSIDRSTGEPTLALGDLRFPLAPGTEDADPLLAHDRQHYRLVGAKSGLCGYRRYHGISSLAALRQEDPEVFETTHRELAAWCEHNLIDGVRVDNPDGLIDPMGYLTKLRRLIGDGRLLLVERILSDGEPLDPGLPIDGTTGYDTLADCSGVLLDCTGRGALTDLSRQFTGHGSDRAWLQEKLPRIKRAVAENILRPEIRHLVAVLKREAGAEASDTMAVTNATIEVLARLPVTRIDHTPNAHILRSVIAVVERRNSELRAPLTVLVAAISAPGEALGRFAQVAAEVTAKALEDTMFYRAVRLVSLQELGSDPGRFGRLVNEFHLANITRAAQWPATMTTLSTHDTKRGEDVRARIGVLSQIPETWANTVSAWLAHTPPPDPTTALFLLQNMFGVWPADGRHCAAVPGLRERLHEFAEKAMREAGERTSWEDPDPEFESAVHTWVDAIVDGPVGRELGELVRDVAPHAWSDSLAQKLLQLCAPGFPDLYQGCELWDDSLVDPDNRRPVDFSVRAGMLHSLANTPPLDATGAAKMWTVAYALWLRRDRPECFVGGHYRPLYARGEQEHKLIAYARGPAGGQAQIVVAVTRHSVSLAETGWGETFLELPMGEWTDRLTGHRFTGEVRLEKVFARLPVALLVR